MRSNDEVRSALTAGRPAHFTTLNADGSPHTDFSPAMPEGTPELVIRITPAKIRGTGPWAS